MTNTPGQQAGVHVKVAYTNYQRGDIKSVPDMLEKAFGLKDEVECYAGEKWQQNHHDFTAAMLDMAVLWYRLGDFVRGDSLASRAQAWADDPNCSSEKNFARSFNVRKHKVRYFLFGLLGRLRSTLQVT